MLRGIWVNEGFGVWMVIKDFGEIMGILVIRVVRESLVIRV